MAERPLRLVREGERAMPWDETAEVSVLGACMLGGDAVTEAAAVLEPEHFYREAHRRLFAAMLAVADRGEPVEPVTLQAELTSRGEWEQVGGFGAVVGLMDAVVTAANIGYHARLVLDAARRRALIAAGTEIVRNAYEPDGVPVSTLVDRAEQLVSQCAEQASGDVKRAGEEIMAVFAQVEEMEKNPGRLAGLSWGLDAVDDATGGLQRGDLLIVAARPSMGKTAFVTGATLSVAIGQQKPVAIFSLEMTRRQMVQRMLCYEALVDISHLTRGQLDDADYPRLSEASRLLHHAPLWVDDSGSISAAEIRAKLRRIVASEPELALVVVDYIQLMRGSTRENRQQEVSEISRALKGVAKEFDVPLVALSQLSRAPEQRSSHRPVLSDLRESGAIEQDADLVAFLFREEYYLTATEAQEKGKVGAAELIIGKQRNGPTGTIDLHFRASCARFEDIAPKWRKP